MNDRFPRDSRVLCGRPSSKIHIRLEMVPGGAFDEFGNGAWDAVDDEIGRGLYAGADESSA